MGRIDSVYRRAPLWAQHAGVTAYGAYWRWLRFGPGFSRALRGFRGRERFTRQDWQIYQKERLGQILRGAAAQVPHYRDSWSEKEKTAASEGRLEQLPFLEKDAIRADPEAFLRKDLRPWWRSRSHTSGTSGTPILSIRTVAEVRESMALREARSVQWAGVSFRQPRATFSGRIVEPDPMSRGPFYRFNAAEGQVYLSAFHLRPDTAPDYLRALGRHGIRWLTGYAVSTYLLGKYALEKGLRVPPLKAIITTSEKVTPEMRRVMEKAYNCRVYEEYSNVENVFFASECSSGRLHVSPDAGVVELVDRDGSPCRPGEVGEVVATGLMGEYQPFIRYRVGDLAQWDPEPCPCGRAMPVLKEVVGRIEEIVTGPDGRQLVRFHGVFIDQPHVREGQIIQETLDRIRVRVVSDGEFGSADREEIVRRVWQRLGSRVEVVVEIVEKIPRTAAGKFQAVVSLLGRGQVDPERKSADRVS